MADFIDAALIFNLETRMADAELGGDGDLLLDETPLTPMLISLGSDRRARTDGALPQSRDAPNIGGLHHIGGPSSRGAAGSATPSTRMASASARASRPMDT